MKPKRLCGRNGCQGIWDGEHCTKCGRTAGEKPKSEWADNRRGTRHERGYDSKWTRLRKAKIGHQPWCEQCLAERGELVAATEVHHIQPFKGINDPLRLDWNNLQSLCRDCHDKATRGREQGGKDREGGSNH